MLIHSNLLGPKFKRQIFQKKLETGQPQDNSLAKSQRVEKRLPRVKRLLKALRASGKGTAKRWPIRASRGNRMRSPLWRTLSKEEDSGGRPKELEQLHMVHRPGKWVENSFHTEPSFIKEQNKAAALPWDNTWWAGLLPPLLQNPYLRLKKSTDLSYTTFILEDANATFRNMKGSTQISHSRKKIFFHRRLSCVIHIKPKAKWV